MQFVSFCSLRKRLKMSDLQACFLYLETPALPAYYPLRNSPLLKYSTPALHSLTQLSVIPVPILLYFIGIQFHFFFSLNLKGSFWSIFFGNKSGTLIPTLKFLLSILTDFCLYLPAASMQQSPILYQPNHLCSLSLYLDW